MTLELANYFMFLTDAGDLFYYQRKVRTVQHDTCNFLHVIQVSQFIPQPLNHSVDKSVNQPIKKSISQSINQSINQSICDHSVANANSKWSSNDK